MKKRTRSAAARSAAWAALASATLPLAALAQDERAEPTLAPVTVIHQTPLPGFDLPLDRFPGHAQQAGDAVIQRTGAGTLPEFMNRRLVGVTVNEVQGSPYQLDLNYRGQRLSPLLGSPIGLSVYLDGVRINQPFGDVVHWEMLPETAIAGLSLVPGSNPLYGLNTLGGALVLTTRSGLTHEGSEVDVSLASFGRKRLDFGHGRRWSEGWHGYAAGTLFEERGWRDESRGKLANVFLKLGREQAGRDWTLSYLQGSSRLAGNGLLNESLYAERRQAIYTAPDITANRESMLTFQSSVTIAPEQKLALLAWYRRGSRTAANGDVDDDWLEWLEACEDDPSVPSCSDPADPGYRGAAAEFNRSRSRQREAGASLQWSARAGAHRFALGAEAAAARIRHDQYSEEGVFGPGRVVQPRPGETAEHEVSLRGRSTRFSLFAADTFELSPRSQLHLAARWNRVTVSNSLGHPAPAVSETFRYSKLNPSLGVSHGLSDALTLFASASQGTRVPTSLELGCADPLQPCVLPTGLQADPYLKQVVARTLELGLRAKPGRGLELSGALFRTTSRDDIVFVRAGATQAGYFTNVNRTLRQGLELAAQLRSAVWAWHASYTWLAATYESSGVLPGPLSTESTPNAFTPGTRLAGLPRHVLKLGAEWRAMPQLLLGADWQAAGSQPVAGNESGSRPELGRVAGHAVLHARARWEFRPGWQAYLRVNNVFDRRYATFGAGNLDLFPQGQPVAAGSEPAAARFLAPGAPRSMVIGMLYAWE